MNLKLAFSLFFVIGVAFAETEPEAEESGEIKCKVGTGDSATDVACPSKTCVRIHTKGKAAGVSVDEAVLSCSPTSLADNSKEDACKKGTTSTVGDAEATVKTCYCKTDLCNGAMGNKFTATTLLVTVVSMLLKNMF